MSEVYSPSVISDVRTEAQWTIGRVLTWSTEFLTKAKSPSPRLDAELLLSHALKLQRIQLYTQFEQPLSAAEREPFRDYLKRRGAGEPVAYITGVKEFMGLSFHVTSAVLIPRPDTELLVEAALAWAKPRASLSILDVGTGSGCIALSLAAKLPQAQVHAWDIDDGALAVALRNGASLNASVQFERRDVLSDAAWETVAGQFDLIVANPPYIRPDEAAELPPSVVGFEPHLALFAPPDGLAFYRQLGRQARRCLVPGGRLMVEIGSTQAEAVVAILRQCGLANVGVHKDYNRLDRLVVAEAGP